MSDQDVNTYDFLINDEDEVMLLLYARPTPPEQPVFELDDDHKSAVLIRNQQDSISLQDIPNEILDALQDTDKLLVCELNLTDEEKDTQIVYAYEAEVTD